MSGPALLLAWERLTSELMHDTRRFSPLSQIIHQAIWERERLQISDWKSWSQS